MHTAATIRTAVRADLAELQTIERAAATLFPEGRIPDLDDVMPMDDLEEAADNGLLLVAALENLVVGFAMGREQDRFLYLAVMAVHPDYGNRGIGRELALAIIHVAAHRNLAGVTLTTFGDLPWNAPFYEKVGFRVLHDSELNSSLRNALAYEESLGMVNRVVMLCEVMV